jgi:hypothetical protein
MLQAKLKAEETRVRTAAAASSSRKPSFPM